MSSMNEFKTALQFLTRLPVKPDGEPDDATFARSARFYPAVGLVVGAIIGLVYCFFSLWFPDTVAAVLCVFTGVAITGALHEDGLADSADGLIGGQDRDQVLHIMRDHQIGVYGAMALFFALALQWSVLVAWLDWSVIWVLIAAHVFSRHAMVEVIARHAYARAETAKFARPDVAPEDLTFARLWTGGVAIVSVFTVGFIPTVMGAVVSMLTMVFFSRWVVRKLGGYTGDILGATQVLAEIAFLLGALAWL